MNDLSSTQKIALFGTSADPPTAGHQTILQWLSAHYDLVVVWASDNPFKAHQTDLKTRSAMLNLTIQEIDKPRHNIILAPEISDRKTLITVQKAQKVWQNAELTFVIGADLVKQIVTWYQIEKLFEQVRLLIIPRSGYQIAESDLNNLQSLGGDYKIANLDAPQVSSSNYRSEKNTTVITPAVREYIQQKQLYSDILTTE